jgi:hypothetical protein
VGLIIIDVSEELIASIFRMETISELGKTVVAAVTAVTRK